MRAVDLIKSIAGTNSRIEKEQMIFSAFMEGHREFFIGAQFACDILVSFGVKKVPSIDDTPDGDPGTFDFAAFLALAGQLRRQELTGNAAKNAITQAALCSNIETWNLFYRPILLKDFKAGIDTKTINKTLKRIGADAQPYLIPVFECQLAHDGANEAHAKKITGRKLLDIKLDGVRLLTILDTEAGTVTQHTRNGKINENFTEITDALKGLLPRLPGSIVLDGEVVGSSFQDLMTQVNRRTGVDTTQTKLALFDIIPLKDFKAGLCTRTQEERTAFLAQLAGPLQEAAGDLVSIIPKVEVDLDTPEGQATYVEFNRQAIDAGFEGFMVKEPTAPYMCKRSDAWLKVKPFVECTLVVKSLERGEDNGKYANTLGALVCEGEENDAIIHVTVGSGLSDAQRDLWWADPSLILGFLVEVRADALTQDTDAKGTNVFSLRFPRLKGVRGTVRGEKL